MNQRDSALTLQLKQTKRPSEYFTKTSKLSKMSVLSNSAQTLRKPFVSNKETNSQTATEDESEYLNRIRGDINKVSPNKIVFDKSLAVLEYIKKKPVSAKKTYQLQHKQFQTTVKKDKPAVQSILIPHNINTASSEQLQPITAKQKYSKTFHVQSQ